MAAIKNTNGQAEVVQQRFLLELDSNEAGSPTNCGSARRIKRPRRQNPAANTPDAAAIVEGLREEMQGMEARLSSLESLLREIHAKTVNGTTVKEYYATHEVARILDKRPYTVREWCRLGRVHGEKSHSGRGLDEEWRISHTELLRIQNEGLLPVQKFAGVKCPRRLK